MTELYDLRVDEEGFICGTDTRLFDLAIIRTIRRVLVHYDFYETGDMIFLPKKGKKEIEIIRPGVSFYHYEFVVYDKNGKLKYRGEIFGSCEVDEEKTEELEEECLCIKIFYAVVRLKKL